ncbi:MAG: radical SAM protein [Lachnospiraceae bacterium]|nr:radical SAM protein [Lachnospiraceae bacterium]
MEHTRPARPLTTMLNMQARRDHIPLSGTFELSPVCNLSCRMCYVRRTAQEVAAHDRPIVTLDQWKQIADEAFDAGLLFLLLTGGEPFFWPQFTELYEYLHKKGLLISINSNGSLISEERIRWLADRPPVRINITLYGAGDETYERLCGRKGIYHRVTETIDRLLSAGIAVKLNASMTPYNAADLEAICRFAKERGLLLEVGTYMFPPVRRLEADDGQSRFTPEEAAHYSILAHKFRMDPEEYQKYLENAASGIVPAPGLDESCVDPIDGQVRCAAGRGSFWITWDGYMIPCGMVPEPKTDIISRGFGEAWRGIIQKTSDIRLSGVCRSCPDAGVCHSCMAMAYTETGKHSGIPTYLCRMAEAIREEAKLILEPIQKETK